MEENIPIPNTINGSEINTSSLSHGVNILCISNDPGIAIEGTPVRLRMRSYADALMAYDATSRFHILTRAVRTIDIEDGPLVIHAVESSALGAILSFPKRARALILTQHIEVVSAQDPFEYGWIALQAVRGTSARLHIQIHTDFLSPWFVRGGIMRSAKVGVPVINRVRRALADYILPRAVAVRAVSQRIRQSLITRYGGRMQDVTVIPVYVGSEVPDAVLLPAGARPFTLLAVARLEPEKRMQDILIALSRLKDSYPAVGLIIAGDGRERVRLERMARRLHISDRVQFLGWRTDSWGLMRSAQAFIQASAYEGYGLTLLEAALARLPIITSDVGIVGEVFEGYEDVLAVPPGDPSALVTAIRGLVEDNEARAEYVVNAEKKALEYIAAQEDQPARMVSDMVRTAHPVA